MFKMNLNVKELASVIMKIMQYFVTAYNQLYFEKEIKKKKIVQIQILLHKQESCYKIQIMYCGRIHFDIKKLFIDAFDEIMKNQTIDQILLATIFTKNDEIRFKGEKMETVVFLRNKIMLINEKIIQSVIRSYWNEYICISLKNKLRLVDVKHFEDCIQNYIKQLKPSYSKIRFVFIKDGHRIMEDSLDADISSCHAIASSMAFIVGGTRNEDFKKKCLDMWHANNAQELDEKVFKQLMYHLENVLTSS